MIDVKKVKYKEIDCMANDTAVCPYCGHENELEGESYTKDGEEDSMECYNCDKTFIYVCNFHVTIDTQPFENHYLDEKKRLEEKVARYQAKAEDSYFHQLMEIAQHELADLERKVSYYLDPDGEEENGEEEEE